MKKKIPGIIMAVAILHFIGGGLGTIGALCGLAQNAMSGAGGGFMGPGAAPAEVQEKQKHNQEIIQESMERHLPHAKAINLVESGVSLVLGITMIVAGIGLLQLRPWGRILSIIYACISIPNRILGTITGFLALAATSEAMDKIMKEDPTFAKSGAPNVGSLVQVFGSGVLIFTALFVLYPIFVLIVMFLPRVKAAFASGGAVPDELENEESWGEQRDANWSDEPEEPDERIRPR